MHGRGRHIFLSLYSTLLLYPLWSLFVCSRIVCVCLCLKVTTLLEFKAFLLSFENVSCLAHHFDYCYFLLRTDFCFCFSTFQATKSRGDTFFCSDNYKRISTLVCVCVCICARLRLCVNKCIVYIWLWRRRNIYVECRVVYCCCYIEQWAQNLLEVAFWVLQNLLLQGISALTNLLVCKRDLQGPNPRSNKQTNN